MYLAVCQSAAGRILPLNTAMHRTLFCTCVLAMIGLWSCQNSAESFTDYAPEAEMAKMEPPRTAEPPPPPPPPGIQQEAVPEAAPPPRRVIYTAEARARVEQLDTAVVQIVAATQAAGGFVESRHRTNSTYRKSAELTLRLPAERLDATLNLLGGIAAQIDYQNLDSRDVSAEWVDLEARLQTKRDVRDRYVDILRRRATKVEDILAAEDKIRVITEEIEARERRLRHLRDQVTHSTLTLELYETIEEAEPGVVARRSFGSKLAASLGDSLSLIEGLILGLATVWPLLLLLVLAGWLVRKWLRRRRKA